MQDWKTLLATPRFRALWLTLICNNLGNWCVIAIMPVLVAQRFGVGTELVLSLGMRLLPKILLAPIAGDLLRRHGGVRIASYALAGEALLTLALPACDDFLLFQILLACIGTLDVFVMPALLSLRGVAIPAGLQMAGNTLCSVADRLAKFAGPILGGIAILAGAPVAFALFAGTILAAAVMVRRLPSPRASEMHPIGLSSFRTIPSEFLAMIRADPIVRGLFIAATTYMIMLGGLRPFLFWANRDWYGASDAAWTGLLAAQGLGALIGALLAGAFSRALLRAMSAYTLTLVTGLLEGALHLALLLSANATQAMFILALASIPEIISTATWFTAMQERMDVRRQGVFFSLAAPLWDCGFAIGLLSATLHTHEVLGLAGYWGLVSLSATLPLIPLLIAHASSRSRLH